MNKSFKIISKIISKWQNVLAIAAIIFVAILHAVIQTYFIQSETEKSLIVEEVSVKAGKIILPEKEDVPVSSPDVKIEPEKEFEPKKINTAILPKSVPQIRQRRIEIVQPKPQPQIKKKEAVETRAERLRRVEKILTGI